IGDRNVTTVPWPLAPQSKPRSLSKTFCRTFSTLSRKARAAARQRANGARCQERPLCIESDSSLAKR
ncbi:hypothetical protein, partial [Mesorhizobium sp. M0809]